MLWVIKINNTKELIIMRSSGLTIRKIVLPIFLVSVALGLLFIVILAR